ncbi:nucleoside triphosphate pyrophosphohydrolase [Thermaurantiacus sp.]
MSGRGDIGRLLSIMAKLRGPGGCPWDRAQDFASIAPYTIEEAYEVADAIARGDMADLRDELGDLLLQVVFHARMAEEAGHFAFADVVEAIAAKMERRHPHVFGNKHAATAEAVVAAWEEIKAAEKVRSSALDGVAKALPALLRADKLSKRAAQAGFDWPDAQGARAKLLEEIAELEAAKGDQARAEEAGDLLFAAVNWLRKLGVEPESALRAACDKFERRFRAIERAPGFADLGLEEKERLWQAAKAGDQSAP